MTEEKWVLACTAAGMINAQIISGRLQSEGIPVRLQYEAIGVISCSLDVDGLGEIKVFVPEPFLNDVKEILEQHFTENDLKWEEIQ